jgi:lipoprotein-anchoring transpeptidase ErfK/SrfK
MLKDEDQLKRLAAITSVVLLATAEGLAQEKQGRPARRIVVSIPDRKLAVLESGKVVKVFPTAVGKPSTPSPAGAYTIVQRIPDPTWYYQGKVVRPGKANPLGTRWMGLSASGYGIHGTNSPGSIGHNVSHGCIRMNNRDVEQLFEMMAVGDAVELLAERTPESEQIFGRVLVTVVGPVAPAQVTAQATLATGIAQAEVGSGGKTGGATTGLGNEQ